MPLEPAVIMDLVTTYGVPLLGAILIFFIGWIIARRADWRGSLMTTRGVDSTLVGFTQNLAYIVLFTGRFWLNICLQPTIQIKIKSKNWPLLAPPVCLTSLYEWHRLLNNKKIVGYWTLR